jgi:hypothetical protein
MKSTKMKLSLVLIFVSAGLYAQNFEGKITYHNSYKSKLANISDDQFATMLGSSQEYLIKDGNYKVVTNGTVLQWMMYINTDNKMYTKMSNSPSILWNDASVNNDEVLKVELNKGVIDILGYSCDELLLTCKSGLQKYYFNSKLALDPKMFENHKYGNWSEFLKYSNAMPLKIVVENAQFLIESIATEVKPMTLNSKDFVLPPNSTLVKSPF